MPPPGGAAAPAPDDLAALLLASERRVLDMQARLDRMTDLPGRIMAERLGIAIALDDPDLLQADLATLRDRVERAVAVTEAERAGLQARQDRLRLQARNDHDDLQAALTRALAERDAARARVAALHKQAARRETQLLSSTSWRVTAPLRALGRLARGWRR